MTYKIGWDCPRCRLLNPRTYPECSRCHCPRPAEEDPVIDRERNPLPRPPRPDKPDVPTPTPQPKPTPKAPETPKPDIPVPPTTSEKPAWKKTCLTLAAAFGAGAVVGKLFLPGYVVLIFEAIKQLLNALGG